MKAKITIKFLFASVQSLFAFSAIILAFLLHFDLLGIQSALNIADEAIAFYVAMFIIFGFIFLMSGLFLIYDWWETRYDANPKST